MFFLGQHHLRKTTLEDVSQQRPLQPKEGLIIAAKIAKAIATLHRTELVHGQICLQHIFIVQKEEVSLIIIALADVFPSMNSYRATVFICQ